MTKNKSELLHGTLELLILTLLEAEPMNGYGIGRRIQELTDDALQVDEGSLYPALYRMQRRGWLASSWRQTENNRRAKFYRITRRGLKQLHVEAANWAHFTTAVTKILQSTDTGG